MTSELIERWERWLQNTGYDGGVDSPPMLVLRRMKDDADEIERLTAQLAEAMQGERAAKEEGVRAGIEAAEQRCRYVGKHNYDRQEEGLYRDGFEVACEVCEGSIRALDPAAISRRDSALSDLIAADAHLIDVPVSSPLADSDGVDGA